MSIKEQCEKIDNAIYVLADKRRDLMQEWKEFAHISPAQQAQDLIDGKPFIDVQNKLSALSSQAKSIERAMSELDTRRRAILYSE